MAVDDGSDARQGTTLALVTENGSAAASPLIDEIRAGYAFQGPSLEFGAAVADGTAHPDAVVRIPLSAMNRHGLVAGATGTGKTKTLQLMAEQLAAQGVPVFLADVKGDLSGMASAGLASDRVTARATEVGQELRVDERQEGAHRALAQLAAFRAAGRRPVAPSKRSL